jgi:hypothetical protein
MAGALLGRHKLLLTRRPQSVCKGKCECVTHALLQSFWTAVIPDLICNHCGITDMSSLSSLRQGGMSLQTLACCCCQDIRRHLLVWALFLADSGLRKLPRHHQPFALGQPLGPSARSIWLQYFPQQPIFLRCPASHPF